MRRKKPKFLIWYVLDPVKDFIDKSRRRRSLPRRIARGLRDALKR